MKLAILEKCFRGTGQNVQQKVTWYSEVLKEQILYEPEENYARHVRKRYSELPVEAREEFVVLWSSVFRKAILEIYNNQCSVSGLKVADVNNNSLVDACYIFPFFTSYNDSIRSGLALSTTFHRAFERGFIAISDNYKVLVHSQLKDYNPQSGIWHYENKEIYLSGEERFYPSVKS